MQDFQLFIKPVGASCNLECSYCYYLHNEEQPSAAIHMSDELLEACIVQQIAAASGADPFFTWHGGEPLLAGIPFFRRVVALQAKHCPPGRTVKNGIQTNGILINEEWCCFFAANAFHIGVSLDGPEPLHNRFRTTKGGGATFARVVTGYQLLRQHSVSCELLCVVHAENVLYPLEVYRFFKSLGVSYLSFLPLVQLSPSGEVSASSAPADLYGAFLCAIFDEWVAADIGEVKIQIFEEALRTAFLQEHTLCIFRPECGRVPVLEAHGDLYSCDHYVRKSHLLGNIMETPLSVLFDSLPQRSFGSAKENTLPCTCLTCSVLPMCNGGCPKDRFLVSDLGEAGLNYLCEGYKMFFTHCTPFVEKVARVWHAQG